MPKKKKKRLFQKEGQQSKRKTCLNVWPSRGASTGLSVAVQRQYAKWNIGNSIFSKF